MQLNERLEHAAQFVGQSRGPAFVGDAGDLEGQTREVAVAAPDGLGDTQAGAAERHVAVDFPRFLMLASKYNRSVNAVSRDADFDDDTWDSFAIFLLLSSDFADPMPIADGSQFGVAVDAILAEDQPGLDWLAR